MPFAGICSAPDACRGFTPNPCSPLKPLFTPQTLCQVQPCFGAHLALPQPSLQGTGDTGAAPAPGTLELPQPTPSPVLQASGHSSGPERDLSKGFAFSAHPNPRITEWFGLEGTLKLLGTWELCSRCVQHLKVLTVGLAQGFRKGKEKIFPGPGCGSAGEAAASQQTLRVLEEGALPFDLF